MTPSNKISNNTDDGVIILHGIFLTRESMRGLSSFLEKSGYKVLNIGYPSTQYPVDQLAEIIHDDINHFIATLSGKVHFVGFSMGGLLIRAYLKQHLPSRLGRIVMIGTPNKGSEIADFMQDFFLYKKLFGPAGQQLITEQKNFQSIFSDIHSEIGIIAGNQSNPISSHIIGKPNDGQVSIESTQLDSATDHIILHCNHIFFPSNKTMWQQVLYFLQAGHFDHSDKKIIKPAKANIVNLAPIKNITDEPK